MKYCSICGKRGPDDGGGEVEPKTRPNGDVWLCHQTCWVESVIREHRADLRENPGLGVRFKGRIVGRRA